MYTLRDYQQAAVDAAINHIRKHTTSCCLDLATGAGKSLVAANIAMQINAISGKKTLVLAPSKELVEQNFEKYVAYGNKASFYSASVGIKSTRHDVVFGTPLSVLNGIDGFTSGFAAVVIDECHGVTNTMRQIIGNMRVANPNLRAIGMTATPYRLGDGYIYQLGLDGKPMPTETISQNPDKLPFFAKLVYRVSTRELIDRGFLTMPEFYSGGVHYGGNELVLNSRGQFDAAQVAEVFEGKGRLTADIVADAVSRSQQGLGVMFFAASINHAHEIVESLPADQTALVTGETGKKERAQILKDFKSGSLRYLVNVSVLTTGFDAPNVGTVAILRATESPGLMLQIIGRGLRLLDGKSKVMILDYAENLERHAPAGDVFDPDIRSKSTTKGDRIDVVCPVCSHTNQFGGKPNPDGFGIDANGYFLGTLGERIINEIGEPIAAHMGQRCGGMSQTAHDVIQCSHRWNFRECPNCAGENALSARECVHCGQELIDPNEKLALKAEGVAIKKLRKETELHEGQVVRVTARMTEKAVGITYWLDGGKHVEEYINPSASSAFLRKRSTSILVELGIAGLKTKEGVLQAFEKQMHKTPRAIAWTKAGDFCEIKHRSF
jgi:DNA repair protein RadD